MYYKNNNIPICNDNKTKTRKTRVKRTLRPTVESTQLANPLGAIYVHPGVLEPMDKELLYRTVLKRDKLVWNFLSRQDGNTRFTVWPFSSFGNQNKGSIDTRSVKTSK